MRQIERTDPQSGRTSTALVWDYANPNVPIKIPPHHLYDPLWEETEDGRIMLGGYYFHWTHIPNLKKEDGLDLFVRMARNMGFGERSITDIGLHELTLGPMREVGVSREQQEADLASWPFERASNVARTLRESHFDAYWNVSRSPDWEVSDDSDGTHLEGSDSEPEPLPPHHSRR